jgi:hypothetical protein
MADQNDNPTENPNQAEPAPVTPAQASPAAVPLETVPASWPGAFGIYKYSRDAVKVNLVTIVVLYIVSVVLQAIIKKALGNPGSIIAALVGVLFAISILLAQIAGVRRQKMEIGDSLSKSLPLFLKYLGLYIIVALSLVVSLLLLVIPFFFVLPRLVLASYYLVDRNQGIMEAYKSSWDASKGHSLKVWGIIGVGILMALLMVTIIGIPVAIYLLIMYSAAFAVLYEYINKKAPAPAPAPAQAPAAENSPA